MFILTRKLKENKKGNLLNVYISQEQTLVDITPPPKFFYFFLFFFFSGHLPNVYLETMQAELFWIPQALGLKQRNWLNSRDLHIPPRCPAKNAGYLLNAVPTYLFRNVIHKIYQKLCEKSSKILVFLYQAIRNTKKRYLQNNWMRKTVVR